MAKICVPVCVSHSDEMRDAIMAAAQFADIIEIRADCLADPAAIAALLRECAPETGRPLIVTMRSPEEGGRAQIDYDGRRLIWSSLNHSNAAYFIDIEVDLVRGFAAAESSATVDWRRVICSHHNFKRVPKDLAEILQQMAATPARILKIAVQADDAVDCLPIFNLLDGTAAKGRQMIAIAMGEAGVMTRVLGPARGSFLTYGSLDDASGTAPGQLTAKELREVYRIDQINSDTQVFGIIGQPVSHSLSPRIHNASFAAGGLNAVYIPFAVRDALQFIRRMAHPKTRELDWKLAGLSVTAPHKSTVIPALNWIDPAAKEIGAVNTIVVRDDQLLGYNTDAAGFIKPLRNMLGSLKHVRCAIIGAGGAARACSWALRAEGAAVTILARDINKRERLAAEFGVKCREFSGMPYSDFDVVINATPVGMRGQLENTTPAISAQLRGVQLAYDLVYNPIETRFLHEARVAGCATISGIEMLLAQALEQFKLWRGEHADIEVMRTAAMTGLSS
ncbi:MAG: shikimate dehydrogenase [Pyrinomonadaceae bacterium]